MNKDSPLRAILVVLVVAVVASSLVSAAVVMLRPIQVNNQLLVRGKNIVRLTGMLQADREATDEEVLSLYKSLDLRLVDIDAAAFDDSIDPRSFDARRAAADPDWSDAIPAEYDTARLGRRARHSPAYLVWKEGEFERIILPVHGAGMWSILYGYVALGTDLNTIAAATFFEQKETPGLGDQIIGQAWLKQWQGRRIYDQDGKTRFAVSSDRVAAGSPAARYEVDALTGATVTADAVTALMHYWFGPQGYQPFLDHLREQPPRAPSKGS